MIKNFVHNNNTSQLKIEIKKEGENELNLNSMGRFFFYFDK